MSCALQQARKSEHSGESVGILKCSGCVCVDADADAGCAANAACHDHAAASEAMSMSKLLQR